MYIYDKKKDKILVYELCSKSDEITDYKLNYLDKTPNCKLYYRLSENNLVSKPFIAFEDNFHNKSYLKSRIIKGKLLKNSEYVFTHQDEKLICNSYLKMDGFLVQSPDKQTYYIPRDEDVLTCYQYNVDALKLTDRLKELWMMEQGRLPKKYYQDILDLFNLYYCNEYKMADIDGLIEYGLVDMSDILSDIYYGNVEGAEKLVKHFQHK